MMPSLSRMRKENVKNDRQLAPDMLLLLGPKTMLMHSVKIACQIIHLDNGKNARLFWEVACQNRP